MDGWWERGGRATPQGVIRATKRSDPRYLVLLVALLASMACDDEQGPPKSDRPAPIPTTPEHRKPMTASELKRIEGLAAAQVAQHKPALVTACHRPTDEGEDVKPRGKVDPEVLKKVAEGSSNTVMVMIVFDEEGNEAAREVTEESQTPTGVASCVGQNLPKITVPAPKRKVRVKIPISLP